MVSHRAVAQYAERIVLLSAVSVLLLLPVAMMPSTRLMPKYSCLIPRLRSWLLQNRQQPV
jgi:hypothetical protein